MASIRIKYNLPKIDFAALRRIIGHFGVHLKPHKGKLILSFVALMGISGTTLLRPWPLKLIFDYALAPSKKGARISFLKFLLNWDPINVALFAAGAVILLAVIGGFLSYGQEMLTKTAGHGVMAAIRMQLFSHIQRLPQSYHDYRETGELITSLTGDISLLQDLLVENFIRLSGQLVIIIGMIVITFFIDWQLALLILAVMPAFFIASFSFSRRIKSAAHRQRQKYGRMVASMEETLTGISQVKVFGQERTRDKLIGKSVSRDYKAGLQTARLTANYSRTVEIISAFGIGLVLLAGTIKAVAGSITPGDLVIFITYVRGIYRPIQTVSRLSTSIAKATVRGEKIMGILELQPEVKDDSGILSARDIIGNIRFEEVKFSYIEGSSVLQGFSCLIPSNKTTVVIGPTGAGKSTIAKLLLRLYDIQDGAILIDENNIKDYKIGSLRKRITNLTQEAFLFRTTIAENIAFGNYKASDDEIMQAAMLVGADEFIQNLPMKYDTLVGEGGFTLSGGQRQRVSFARAALRNSPVMIFDEPASGLDIHSEKGAKKALQNLKKARTLIIITHRLNFLELADWAVYVRNGRLIQQGVPAELINLRGSFYDFVADEINRTGYEGWPQRILKSSP